MDKPALASAGIGVAAFLAEQGLQVGGWTSPTLGVALLTLSAGAVWFSFVHWLVSDDFRVLCLSGGWIICATAGGFFVGRASVQPLATVGIGEPSREEPAERQHSRHRQDRHLPEKLIKSAESVLEDSLPPEGRRGRASIQHCGYSDCESLATDFSAMLYRAGWQADVTEFRNQTPESSRPWWRLPHDGSVVIYGYRRLGYKLALVQKSVEIATDTSRPELETDPIYLFILIGPPVDQ